MQYTLAAVTNSDGSLSDGWAIALLVVLGVIALALLAFIIAALVSVVTSDVLAGGGKAVWFLLILAFPLLGAALWFLWGRKGQFTQNDVAANRAQNVAP
ncbi:MAG: PLD nuclease N-terminal domain-containing protein [Corynebacterium sp.]|uniref:PLD nuclease N-terminal domain-containing protein n=1 Tax=unclassified Corynebacterium TaxID=2624378 RepID=UPI00264A281C|nr:PLD nuclease N-terminal domain-containing protein [Corynebacterium sp.]MDN5581650.1 PLD nuclease N-terminal domain-containing protein [Corynebacterium sp.]MDN5718781.1 PLD nuclease N-terminal domain-containing protein [Corynebacterium sp.]MDN6324182.1 PLD nuclease N-terminal domain-containing protein [Corynebacterium sp.]MDN6511315.1 PLD nuclease N-terminal domain-containing protein [Corynebacterium sp.]